MASRTKLVFTTLATIAFCEVIVFLIFEQHLSMEVLIAIIIHSAIIGMFILFFTTMDITGPFGNEELLEWMAYKFIPGLCAVVIIISLIFKPKLPAGTPVGGRRRKH